MKMLCDVLRTHDDQTTNAKILNFLITDHDFSQTGNIDCLRNSIKF